MVLAASFCEVARRAAGDYPCLVAFASSNPEIFMEKEEKSSVAEEESIDDKEMEVQESGPCPRLNEDVTSYKTHKIKLKKHMSQFAGLVSPSRCRFSPPQDPAEFCSLLKW